MRDVLIAGAGLGGLTAALALIQRGHRVRVFEQAAELKEVGAGVQIGSNGSRLLIALGLRAGDGARGLRAARPRVPAVEHRSDLAFVRPAARPAVQRFGAPYWMVHRGDFHAVLLDAVRGRIRTRSSPATPASGSNR